MHNRFFPGPQGTGANVVVPMTDFSLPNIDGNRMTEEALQTIKDRTGRTRQRLRDQNFAQGNKIASEQRISPDGRTKEDILIELYGGPTLRDDFRFMYKLPQTPATLMSVPTTMDSLLEIYADRAMGGNTSNVLRNEVHLSSAGLGPREMHFFSPTDKYLDNWLQEKFRDGVEERFERHELKGINSRTGLALPYEDPSSGKTQQFSLNTPQGSTIGPMEELIARLQGLDHVIVSEGIGVLLAKAKISITQIFNPTSALHAESALEMHRRKEEFDVWQDIAIVNDDEMEEWIKTMEIKQNDLVRKEVPDAKFPMPFLKDDPSKIDLNSVNLMRASHQRFMNLGAAKETKYVNFEMGVGCGPKGGQNHFQCRGEHYVAASSTLSEEGASKLIDMCGLPNERGVQLETRDVVGAGDAAFTATLMHRHYAPLEDIINQRHPNLSDERTMIATMAFTTMLQRVFGELVYHSRARDLSGVPPEAFPKLFDAVLDKAIAAAHKITMIEKVPSNVYRDEEWGMSFMTMKIER